MNASWKVLPDANMRVASALGVSAEISALPAAALALLGAWQVIVWPAWVLAVNVVPRVVPFAVLEPAAVLPLAVEPVPLFAVALLPLPEPPPPPPQPANTSNKEESSNEGYFICKEQSMNTGRAAPRIRCVAARTNIGFDFRQAMPRRSLRRSLPADIGGSKRGIRTLGAPPARTDRCLGWFVF
ncbi:hypothetical protein [Paraburkholderia phenazinium]|uniref:hypothetical protein n=1 Tax=Paraburkholderia phenazinium TaxID=60549 RepID=UPI001FD45A33|nr:hypothetical protein [Paraburkholderia phenazinium]